MRLNLVVRFILLISLLAGGILTACQQEQPAAPKTAQEQKALEASKAAPAKEVAPAPVKEVAQKPAAGKQRSIGIVGLSNSEEGPARLVKAAVAAAEKRGWKTQVVDGQGDLNKIIAGFENLIEAKVDALVSAVVEPRLLGDIISKANKAGIPIIGEYAGWAPGMVADVNANNWVASSKLSTYMVDRMGGKGGIVIFNSPIAASVRSREAALKAVLQEYPDVKIIQNHVVKIPGAMQDARQTMEALLKQYPNPGQISAVWAGWDEPAGGAAQAIEAAGRKDIFAVAFDGNPWALKEIQKDGAFKALIFFDLELIGEITIQQLELVFDGKKPEATHIYIDSPLIDKYNVPKEGFPTFGTTKYLLWKDFTN